MRILMALEKVIFIHKIIQENMLNAFQGIVLGFVHEIILSFLLHSGHAVSDNFPQSLTQLHVWCTDLIGAVSVMVNA